MRLFKQHRIRETGDAGGLWDFVPACERGDPKRKWPSAYTRRVWVPSAWETLPGLETYRGRGWYRTRVSGPPGPRALRVVFGGVSHTGTAYLDGEQIGRHCDAFTPWSALVTGVEPGVHELGVEVDNSLGPHSALHPEDDYFTYGGITRPVEIQWVRETFVENCQLIPFAMRGKWGLHLAVSLRNWSDSHLVRNVFFDLEGTRHALGNVRIPGGGRHVIRQTLRSLDVSPWTPSSPRLYEGAVVVECDGQPVDDLRERIGFRTVQVDGRKILLNGRSVRLLGFNRHEDHPLFGCAIPVECMVNDLNQIRDMGGNFVRTSHYPNDMRFLDLCDEIGVLVWEESHARHLVYEDERFPDQLLENTREMVHWHINHPSILMWGCLSEWESDTRRGRPIYEKVIQLIRELDPSRPVTFASNRADRDLCLDLVDVVAWSRYVGWHQGRIEDIESDIAGLVRWLDGSSSGARGKPLLLSAFGAAALYGNRQTSGVKWTEEYQHALLDESLRVYAGHSRIAGALVWQFCDCRLTPGEASHRFLDRPRCMDNGGVVDEYRRPKMACEAVRRRMRGALGLT